MGWLGSRARLTVERAPSSFTLIAAERPGDRAPKLLAAESFDRSSESLTDEIRQFRASARLPSSAALVLWPEHGDAGVGGLDSPVSAQATLPKARVIRDRVAPFVHAGGQVREVLLPHEAVARLVTLAGWTSACVLVLEPTMVCLAMVEGDTVAARYLDWAPPHVAATETARLLARYQFAARLVPHLRALTGRSPGARVAVCGRFPDLRSAMLPLVEEFDREVDVLDDALVGQSATDAAEVAEPASYQLAWAAAASR